MATLTNAHQKDTYSGDSGAIIDVNTIAGFPNYSDVSYINKTYNGDLSGKTVIVSAYAKSNTAASFRFKIATDVGTYYSNPFDLTNTYTQYSNNFSIPSGSTTATVTVTAEFGSEKGTYFIDGFDSSFVTTPGCISTDPSEILTNGSAECFVNEGSWIG